MQKITREQLLIIVSICNTIIDKADPNKEEYEGLGIGVDEDDNIVVECGGDLLSEEQDITEHLEWVFDVLCKEV